MPLLGELLMKRINVRCANSSLQVLKGSVYRDGSCCVIKGSQESAFKVQCLSTAIPLLPTPQLLHGARKADLRVVRTACDLWCPFGLIGLLRSLMFCVSSGYYHQASITVIVPAYFRGSERHSS